MLIVKYGFDIILSLFLGLIITGAPGAPSPNLAAAAAPTGGKASDDYNTWGQYNYNHMSGDTSGAAAFNHGRGYGAGGAQAQATGRPGE